MLHKFLTEHRDEIVTRCEARYRERYPGWTRDELLNTIPAFIDELIKAERREAGIPEHTSLPGFSEEARAQGAQRFRRGRHIRDVSDDYAAISQVIGEIAIEHGVELDPRSYKMLNECLDAGVADAIETFFDLHVKSTDKDTAEWLGFLAHELRNSLGSAVLAYSFIRSGHVGPQSKTARVLERSFNQLESLVSQTLAAVQLKSGVTPAHEPIRVAELIEDVEAGIIHERDIAVHLAVDGELTVQGDPRLIGSAITNLLQNALKFTHSGGRVHVRAQLDGDRAKIEVEDECGGLQMPVDALFEPFVQQEHAHRGVGLGLAITRKAIEAHHGTLTATNLPDKGCIFTIVIPCR